MTETPLLCARSVFSMASAVPCILRTALGMAAGRLIVPTMTRELGSKQLVRAHTQTSAPNRNLHLLNSKGHGEVLSHFLDTLFLLRQLEDPAVPVFLSAPCSSGELFCKVPCPVSVYPRMFPAQALAHQSTL